MQTPPKWTRLLDRISRHGVFWLNSGHPSSERNAIVESWQATSTVTIADWGIRKETGRALTADEFRSDDGTLDREAVRDALIEARYTDDEGNPETRRAGQAAGVILRFCDEMTAGTPVLVNLPGDTFGACVVTGDWVFDEDHPATAEDEQHVYARPVDWLRRGREIARFDRDILPRRLHRVPDLTNARVGPDRAEDLIDVARVVEFLAGE